MYIVNWYPGSYGDRIIKDLFGLDHRVTEKDLYSLPITPLLKLPEFYNYDSREWFDYFYPTILNNLATFGVIGAHRLNGFDFTKFLPKVSVISIDPSDQTELIAENFFKKVQGVRLVQDNPVITHLLNKKQFDSAKSYKQKLIANWKNSNILNKDIVFSLNRYINDPNYCQWFKTNALS